jgi:raffinose/stachyose/melibiose transport system permease protein
MRTWWQRDSLRTRRGAGPLQRALDYAQMTAWALIVLLPVTMVVMNSFKPLPQFLRAPQALPDLWTVENYASAWTKGRMGNYFQNSVIVSFSGVFFTTLLSALAGYALARFRFRLNFLIYLFFLTGLMIPFQLIMTPLFKVVRDFHLSKSYLSIIVPYIAVGLPFSVFLLTNFFRTMSSELIDAARIDGAGEFTIFTRIMLPLAQPALATVVILNFLWMWNDFFLALVLITKAQLRTLPVGMVVFFGMYLNNWVTLFAAMVMATIPLTIIYLVASERFIGGLMVGALKG